MDKMSKLNSVLIANRGEIAVRIINTARKLGIRSVAVYSAADADAMHVAYADESVAIGGALPAQSYLNIAAIIDAALKAGCQAIHPGYGFLSENPEFADSCVDAGLIFIGPKSSSLRAMGHKDAAKQRMLDAGVPVVPGYHGTRQELAFLAEQALTIGYPLLIKARAGGGGKGMRLVSTPEDFGTALASAQREAASAFGDDHMLLEKYITNPRHIEVQVFGDQLGNVVHMYERDCSLQRRHQKVIEESPAPGIDDAFRQSICEAAVTAAKSIDYEGAGTIEFIVDASGAIAANDFWFMEMNTRLQVEHPVTESVTGIDLVEWQFIVAAGQALPLQQKEITLQGHAVEARLYAEDVPAGFLPATGRLELLRWPIHGRVDSGVRQGDKVLPFYDPMLAKLIATGKNRQQAFAQLSAMLQDTVMLGTVTNRDFLLQLCCNTSVLAGRVSTTLIEEQRESLVPDKPSTSAAAIAAFVLTTWPDAHSEPQLSSKLGAWQLWGQANRQCELVFSKPGGDQHIVLNLERQADGRWLVSAEGVSHTLKQLGSSDWQKGCEIELDGTRLPIVVSKAREFLDVHLGKTSARIVIPQRHKGADSGQAAAELTASMPGMITQIFCANGQELKAGAALLSLEAMKMEQTLDMPHDVVIKALCVEVGQQVSQGQVLVRFEIDADGVKKAD